MEYVIAFLIVVGVFSIAGMLAALALSGCGLVVPWWSAGILLVLISGTIGVGIKSAKE